MPVYEYRARDVAKACPYCSESFEVDQRMSEPPLKVCPECGAPVKRTISLFSVHTGPTTRSLLSDKNIKRHGFTKLVNEGNGKFRKI
jgi:putative FmdB family regulatory protein